MTLEIQILLQYRLQGAEEWVKRSLTPTEYFDLEPGEKPSLDSVPQYNHARQYIDVPLKNLAETRIIIDSIEGAGRRTIIETFWGEGRHCLIERLDHGPEPYRELILCSEVRTDPNWLEIIRLVDKVEKMTVTSHVIIETLPNGSEQEVHLFNSAENYSP